MESVGSTRRLGMTVVEVLLIGICFAAGSRPAAAADDPLSVMEEAVAIVNTGDVDAFRDMWTDDGVFMDDPCFALYGPAGCVGKTQVQSVMDVFIPDDFHWETVLTVSGNTVRGRAEGSWGALGAMNIERVLFDAWWDVVDGKIAVGHFDTDLSDPDSAKWPSALFASVAPSAPATGGAGLVATNRQDGGGLAWPVVAGAALIVPVLGAWRLAGRQSAA